MSSHSESLESLRIQQKKMLTIFKPEFYRLSNEEDQKSFRQLLLKEGITVFDNIAGQISELVKIKQPDKKFSTEELESLTNKQLGGSSFEDYGVWIYYPWSNRLVHVLDEEEFVLVRTSRNQYKITPEERDVLAKKRIGIIGLSVGQSVSVTLAMERICGELRLADFDILELTNLNRIRTGVHNLGLPKVYSVAREIAEIDPYIKVICFPDGLKENNMDEFFLQGGKLDLLVEESDGFDIKLLSRFKARSLQIPVIMEGSDRCLVDVERFDLEPKRSILHGLVDHLDVNLLKTLRTNEEKIPYMLDILGIDDSSLRLRASMLEIEQTINTWPQLASAVTMGGGITADVSRRLLLNQYTDSGRYHIDIEELIGNKIPAAPANYSSQIDVKDILYLSKHFNPSCEKQQIQLTKQEAEILALAGSKAPSGGNSQPWNFVYKNGSLGIFMRFDSSHTILGFDNLASLVGIGAAAENITLKAKEMGYETKEEIFPDDKIKELAVNFRFYKRQAPLNKEEKDLIECIGTRLTNRKLGARVHIENDVLKKLQAVAEDIEGSEIKFFTEEKELAQIGEILSELEKLRLLDQWGHHDFVQEIRWSDKENNEMRDGVDLRTIDLTNTEKVGLQVARDEKVMQLLNQWKGGGAFKKLTKKSIDAAGAVGILSFSEKDKKTFLKGGRAIERLWLQATAMGLSFQPMAAAVFLFARMNQGKGTGMSQNTIDKFQDLRPAFEKIFKLKDGQQEVFIFRLNKNTLPDVTSLRKPLEELFCYCP